MKSVANEIYDPYLDQWISLRQRMQTVFGGLEHCHELVTDLDPVREVAMAIDVRIQIEKPHE